MPRILRTSSRLAAVAAVVLLTVTGCSSAASGSSEEDAGLLPAAEGATRYPLTITTPYGDTVLEERPQRIAVVGGLGDLEALIALGGTPVLSSGPDDTQWLLGDERYEAVGEWFDLWSDGVSAETVLASEPDLILAVTHTELESDFERLASIAPVLALEEEHSYDWEWQDVTRVVGEALDLQERAETVVAETDAAVVAAAEAHPEYAGRTVAVIANRGEPYGIEFVNGAGSRAEALLGELGFAEHPSSEEFTENFSLENLGAVEGDALIIAQHGGDEVDAASDWLAASPLFQSLDVVQRDAVRTVERNPDTNAIDLLRAFSYPSALSIQWAVAELETTFDGLFAG